MKGFFIKIFKHRFHRKLNFIRIIKSAHHNESKPAVRIPLKKSAAIPVTGRGGP
jgi:hypothetical protein